MIRDGTVDESVSCPGSYDLREMVFHRRRKTDEERDNVW
jgi:hypothetical protein